MYTITIDFVIALSIVSSKDILWAIEGFDAFDVLFIVICKSFKRKLLFSDNEKYSVED
jgi:hypothetical protein